MVLIMGRLSMVGSTYKDDGNLGSHCEYDSRGKEKICRIVMIVIALRVVEGNLVMVLLGAAFIPFIILSTLVKAYFDGSRPSGRGSTLDCKRSLQLDLARIDKE